MRFYKKNPEIRDTITVQGVALDDEKIVCGDRFAIFADPATFPGIPVRLIEVDFSEMSRDQQRRAADCAAEHDGIPPRSLGVIKSDQFQVTPAAEVKVVSPPPRPVVKEQEKPVDNGLDVLKKHIESEKKSKTHALETLFSLEDFIDTFPGVTPANAQILRKKFKTLDELVEASNSTLRACGVKPNFFGRLRDRAQAEIDELE